MKYFVFLFLIILILGMGVREVRAVGYSPSSLIFNLNMGEEQCKMITIDSDSEKITLSDRWAENKDVKWDVNLFKNDSSYNSLYLKYPKTLGKNEKEAKVCIKGTKKGEYHGVLLLREEQKGNSVIQLGIWIKAMVGDKVQNKSNNWFSTTGNVIGNLSKKINVYYIIGILAALIAAGIVFNLNKKKDLWKC